MAHHKRALLAPSGGPAPSVERPGPPTSNAEARGCRQKRRYLTSGHAQNVADNINRDQGRRGRTAITIYSCTFCGGFHLTSRRRP